ncbi:helix-turn-helix transcriptional regulator [Candidatus Aenigmatarchaeota archaeon]
MKKFLLIVIVLLVALSASVNAATVRDVGVDIILNDDRSADWVVNINYHENVLNSDYFILSTITNVETFIGNNSIQCEVIREIVGNSILCDDIDTDKITYKFTTPSIINSLEDFMQFSYRLPVSQIIDNIHVRASLPLGMAVVDSSSLTGTGLNPFEPLFGNEGSDGRIIYISWDIEQPALGDPIDMSIIYEEIGSIEQQAEQLVAIVILIAVVAVIAFYFIYSRKSNIKDILPILTEGERRLMTIIIREKKPVDQRDVVKELDYSKSKVSRIVSDLVKRGLVEKKAKGRTNLLKMKTPKTMPEETEKTDKKKDDIVKKLLGKE